MPQPPTPDDILIETIRIWREHDCRAVAAAVTAGVNPKTFASRLTAAKARGFHLSEGARGIVRAAKLAPVEAKGGWIHSYDDDGKKIGATRWSAPEDVSQEDIRDVIRDALADIQPLPPIPPPDMVQADLNRILPVADLHYGGEYGRPEYDLECKATMDRLLAGACGVERTTIIDLGDTTDANDHVGVTPGGKNPVDVKRHTFLHVAKAALGFLKHLTYRALETSDTVEVHVLRGNHSETSYAAVLIGLAEHFALNPRVTVVMPPEEGPEAMFRLIRWGACGVLADHGDRMKWKDLKDVWTTSFAQHWADCTAYRGIYTAHFHRDRMEDLAGCEARHFRSLSAPSHWAAARFPPMPRSASALTLHRRHGLVGSSQARLHPIAA